MKLLSTLLISIIVLSSCHENEEFDLIIINANVLDVNLGKQKEGQTICIKNGTFSKILSNVQHLKSKNVIDAEGKLVTPTFIDTHIHPISEFSDGNYDLVPDTIPSDSIAYYRENLTDGYLPDGTTTVLMMGHPDSWTDEFLNWSKNPNPNHVDVYTCGGALATEDDNTYKGHLRVSNPIAAKKQIIEYHKKGIQHLKLYWRLKEPEFKSIRETADSLNMKMYAHSGGFFDPTQLTVYQAMEMGIRNFEHIAILPCSVFDNKDWEIIHEQYQEHFGAVKGEGLHLSLLYILETFKHANEYKRDSLIHLIDKMAENQCNISTTIGWVYKTYHDTFFAKAKISNLSHEQYQRCHENFKILMDYLNMIHKKGIPIRIGSDTNPGGKIVLLEIKLMAQYGMGMEHALKIGTINGAEAMGISDNTGSIEKGKEANFIIWDKSPFVDENNLLGAKDIFKNGKLINS